MWRNAYHIIRLLLNFDNKFNHKQKCGTSQSWHSSIKLIASRFPIFFFYLFIPFSTLIYLTVYSCWSQSVLEMFALSIDTCTEVGLPCHTFHSVVRTVHHTVVVSHVSLNAGCVDPSWMKPCDPNIIWRLAPPTIKEWIYVETCEKAWAEKKNNISPTVSPPHRVDQPSANPNLPKVRWAKGAPVWLLVSQLLSKSKLKFCL